MASYLCISVMAVLLLLATAAAVEREAAEEQKTKHTNTGGTAAEDEESWGTWAKEKISGGLGFKHQPHEDSYAGPLSLSLSIGSSCREFLSDLFSFYSILPSLFISLSTARLLLSLYLTRPPDLSIYRVSPLALALSLTRRIYEFVFRLRLSSYLWALSLSQNLSLSCDQILSLALSYARGFFVFFLSTLKTTPSRNHADIRAASLTFYSSTDSQDLFFYSGQILSLFLSLSYSQTLGFVFFLSFYLPSRPLFILRPNSLSQECLPCRDREVRGGQGGVGKRKASGRSGESKGESSRGSLR